jgi:hypothetical protein
MDDACVKPYASQCTHTKHTQSSPHAGALAAKRARASGVGVNGGSGDEDHTADQVRE